MSHIVLLGDSVFDNSAYTGGEPDVVSHLRSLLPRESRATLVAVDGATTADLAPQVARVPREATHLVVSVGGNDVLMHSDVLRMKVTSAGDVFSALAARANAFESAYRSAILRVLDLRRPTILCTIYNGNLDPAEARLARVALTAFDDVILRVGVEHRTLVVELRLVCADADDYANPIEPSGQGGRKIAEAILRAIAHADRASDGALVIGR